MIKPEWLKSLVHCSNHEYLSNPYPRLGEVIVVNLVVASDAPVQQIILRTLPDGEQQFISMKSGSTQNGLTTWQADLTINQPQVAYRFGVQSHDYVWWLNAEGADIIEPFTQFDFKIIANLQPISWLGEAIFYQIFPDRFANGDPSNDPKEEQIPYRNYIRTTLPWGEPGTSQDYGLTFYGGDLQGMDQHISHLLELGINAVYLNPIFSSHTNHRYDCTDYEHVDPTLGGDSALVKLRQTLDHHRMHLLLDIAPNHCSLGHHWFQHAQQDPESAEAGFFYFDEGSGGYESWMGHRMLPKLNYASQELRRRMYADDDSIFRKWLLPPFNVDGWRVDVANMLGKRQDQQFDQEVISGIRQAVKTSKPDVYLIGENFYEAASQLDGRGWDGVMNYAGFSAPLWYWLTGYQKNAMHWEGHLEAQSAWPTEALVRTWQGFLASIPWQIALQQFNLLDSHDTNRIRTILKGNEDLQRLAAIIQFTFPGVPCIYYGDEIGLSDAPGFGSRNCMDWDRSHWKMPLWDFYRELIAFRKNSNILQKGSFKIIHWEEDFILYERALDGHRVWVSANRSSNPRPAAPISVASLGNLEGTTLNSLFDANSATIQSGCIHLPKLEQGGAVWVEQSSANRVLDELQP